MKLKLSETYDIVTEESARHGDTAEAGFIRENESVDLHEAVDAIEQLGCFELSSFPSIYACDSLTDIHTGNIESRALHFAGTYRALKWLYYVLERIV